jgi:hypothetical protein
LAWRAFAAPLFSTAGGEGEVNDLFDVAQGVQTIASSPQYSGFFGVGCCGQSDPRSVFGFTTPAYNGASGWVEPTHTIFQDGPGAGTVDFIEWQTAGPVNLTNIALRMQQDGVGNSTRAATDFKLFASVDGVTFSQISGGTIPGAPGANLNVPLLVTDNALTGTTTNVRSFRLEVTRASSGGARIVELDATGAPGAAIGTFLDRLAFNASTNAIVGRAGAVNDDEGPGLATNFTVSSRVLGTDTVEDAFGNANGAVEPEDFIFGDGGIADNGNQIMGDANETVDFIAWHTTQAISLAGFRLWISGDGASSNRDTQLVRFLVGGQEVDFFDNDGFDGIVTRIFSEGAMVGADFRIEFTRGTDSGPRIIEIDAITGPPTPLNGELVLNEVVSSNDDSLHDEDRAAPDWIELFNGRDVDAPLAGFGLSDDPALPFKWTFPAVTMPPHTYLVVFASGKDRRVAGANLHTNFQLKVEGESIVLTRPGGVTHDTVPVVRLREDVSVGRYPNGTGAWKFFGVPTPGRSNNSQAAYESIVFDAPVLTLPPGFYSASQALALYSAEAGVTLHYTLDSAEPAETSPEFTAPIPLLSRAGEANVLSLIQGTSTANQHTDGWKPPVGEVRKCTVVRARATRPGALPGPITTGTYFIGSDAVRADGLPTLSIVTPQPGLFDYNQGIYMLGAVFDQYVAAHPGEALTGHTPANYTQRGSAWERPGNVEWFDNGGLFRFTEPAAIDIQGQSSRSFREKSLGLKARGTEAPSDTFTFPFFPGLNKLGEGTPLTEFRHLRLRNTGNDWDYAMMRDDWCARLAAGLGINTMSSRPLSTYIDGEYWGVLSVREQQDTRYIEAHYGVNDDEGVILNGPGTLEDGLPGDEQPWLDLLAYCDTHDLSNQSNFDYVAARVDPQDAIFYFLSEIYFGNADWPQNNIRVWRRRLANPDAALGRGKDGRWRWFLFDVDLGMSHPWSGGVGENTLSVALSPTGRPGTNASWGTSVLRALLTNPAFKRDFINTAADLLNSSFTSARATGLVNTMESELLPAMDEHLRRWQSCGGSVATWRTRVQTLRDFAAQRTAYVRSHFTSSLALGPASQLTVNVNNATRGSVRINRLLINSSLPGVSATPYPWSGSYFNGVPITLEAVSAPGWRFSHWIGLAATTPTVTFAPNGSTAVSAYFIADPPEFMTIERLPPQMRFVLHGTPGATYTLQSSADLAAWSDAGNFACDGAGNAEVFAPVTAEESKRFFRAVSK